MHQGFPAERPTFSLSHGIMKVWLGNRDLSSLHRSINQRPKVLLPRHNSSSRLTQQIRAQGEEGVHDVEEHLQNLDPEAKSRIERVRAAAALVATLQAERSRVEREIHAAQSARGASALVLEQQQAQRASERGAAADVQEAARLLQAAQTDLTAALAEQAKWREDARDNVERGESAKAGMVAAAGGALAALPLSIDTDAGVTLLSAGVALMASFLFGITFRYAVRQDRGNVQLKAGVVAAFGLVLGLPGARDVVLACMVQHGSVLEADVLGPAALSLGAGMLTVAGAAVAVEAAFQSGLLLPFGER